MEIYQVSSLPPLDAPIIAFDIETTTKGKAGSKRVSADPYQDRIVSLQISDGNNVWIMRNNYVSAIPLLSNPEIKKVGQNLAFDIGFLKHHLGGIEISNVHDTLMAERMLTSGLLGVENGLDDILSRRLGIFTDKSIRSQFSDHRGEFTQEQLEYMATDVAHLLKIRELQLADISKAGMGKVLALENAVVPIVAQMQLDGIGLDRELWQQHVQWYKNRMEQIKLRVCQYLDIPYQDSLFGGVEIGINLSSSDQVKAMLNKLGCPMDSTREAYLQEALVALDKHNKAHTFISDILEWRGWDKMIGYAYDSFVNPITGKVHPNWNQQGAQTGRLSCSEPNVQQAKSSLDDPDEPNTRAIFPPEEGEVYIVGDFAQQEPRVLAEISGDERMQEAARLSDMYIGAGKEVYGKEISKKDTERKRIKIGMLAHFYGASYRKIAYTLNVSEDEAKDFQSRLNRAFPKAKQWGDRQVQYVVQHGYMTSIIGRRCWVKEAMGAAKEDMWHFRNQALNGPMQMTGADMGKEAMRRFYDWRLASGYTQAKIRMAIHDELVVSCPREDADMVKYNVEQAMISAMESMCPNVKAEIEVDVKERWLKG